ncbi:MULTISPECIES: enoyl-CoA hydratase/isomerase family protein [unclassified Rhodococcus (in: high G+C Gram-positive bacteria)]|uniref:enoyl-CoA hydratase/isomerase family protein n=1 Tax=unclassified Rhodococcus (in: high G+C Gram-positive bacteria) TaxID=192944 RepID=UPI0006F3F0A9|nr:MULTISPECIES: enoyl-CoA hydratase-related protein [unclassified Rhodococcus (in: high G+C Gram-positive bacteria)]KQU38391.1 enoyl-CoA hydratase [Rhodococcus sp. Leaf225]KQU39754.1 enoyl-CoA hydratase [Rhodococcus sp. Leaf258]
MGNGDIEVESAADHVATIEMRRGPDNYFDTALIQRLGEALNELAEDGCRAVVLCSEGRNFCAGARLKPMSSSGAAEGPHLYDVAITLFEQPLPIVAAVQGAAVGGGLGLALAADFRVVADNARFTASFARLGFHHGFGMTATLPAVVGSQTALDLLFTGRRVGAAEAKSIGLCDDVVPADELRARARARALTIAQSAPLAVRSIRATMRRTLVDDVRAAVSRERSEQERLMATADFTEGVTAMSERRDPDFHGA